VNYNVAITNEITTKLIMQIGRDLAKINQYAPEMVCIEGLAAGLIASAAVRYNKHPDELMDAFCVGVKERFTQIIYGPKQ